VDCGEETRFMEQILVKLEFRVSTLIIWGELWINQTGFSWALGSLQNTIMDGREDVLPSCEIIIFERGHCI